MNLLKLTMLHFIKPHANLNLKIGSKVTLILTTGGAPLVRVFYQLGYPVWFKRSYTQNLLVLCNLGVPFQTAGVLSTSLRTSNASKPSYILGYVFFLIFSFA